MHPASLRKATRIAGGGFEASGSKRDSAESEAITQVGKPTRPGLPSKVDGSAQFGLDVNLPEC
jgi:hypothetical protein